MGLEIPKFAIIVILFLFLTVVGVPPAFSYLTTDSDSGTPAKANYAGTSIVYDYTCGNQGGDDDHDGICKWWEDGHYDSVAGFPGLHVRFTDNSINGETKNYGYDLPCDTALPGDCPSGDSTTGNTKDIYLELDWMSGQDIDSGAKTELKNAFSNMGINLHVQLGESSSSGDILKHYCAVKVTSGNNVGLPVTSCSTGIGALHYQNYAYLKQNFFGTTAERGGSSTNCPLSDKPSTVTLPVGETATTWNCLTAKRQAFHHTIASIYQSNLWTSSGWGEIFGNDFFISMGSFHNSGKGNIDEQEGALMHELGHNLALNHGGAGLATNCKPNYFSVMNYLYEFRNNDVCRPLEFSNAVLPSTPLDETPNHLQDSNIGSYHYPATNLNKVTNIDSYTRNGGICSTNTERKIFWAPSYVPGATTGTTEDWNLNGNPGQTYSQNLHNFGGDCTDTTLQTLPGYDDVTFIKNGDPSIGFPVPLVFRHSLNNFYNGLVVDLNQVEFSGDNLSEGELSTIPSTDSTNTAVSVNPSSVNTGGQTTATATVTDTTNPSATPTGIVSFSDGSPSSGGTFGAVSCNTSGNQLVCTTTYTAPGTSGSAIITGNYPGNSNFIASSGGSQLTVVSPPIPNNSCCPQNGGCCQSSNIDEIFLLAVIFGLVIAILIIVLIILFKK